MELTIVAQSLLPPKSGQDDPWPLVVLRIRESGLAPDFLLLNECRGWADHDGLLLERAKKDLQMDTIAPAASRSGLGTLIMYRPETVGRPLPLRPATDDPSVLHEDWTGRTLHGWSIGWWQVGLPQPLAVASYKLTPYSVDAARAEAAYIASHIYRMGAYAALGGDVNFSPLDPDNPPPNWASQYPYNIGSRALSGTGRTAAPVPDRSVARQFADKGLDDVAWQYAQATGERGILKPTSEYDRIDIGYVTPNLTPAITGYQTLSTPAEASDHNGFAFRLDTALAQTAGQFTWR
jgi:hypothetical protein